MEARDLRIGNWVKTCMPNMEIMIPVLEAEVQAVYMFGEIEFCHRPDKEGFTMPVKHITGIPLSGEWAMKNCNSHTHYHDGVVVYDFGPFKIYTQNSSLWVADGLSSFSNKFEHIKFVHQLQNLYFAILGTELTIK